MAKNTLKKNNQPTQRDLKNKDELAGLKMFLIFKTALKIHSLASIHLLLYYLDSAARTVAQTSTY